MAFTYQDYNYIESCFMSEFFVFSVMVGWIAEMLFILFCTYIAV